MRSTNSVSAVASREKYRLAMDSKGSAKRPQGWLAVILRHIRVISVDGITFTQIDTMLILFHAPIQFW
jgi:hypothetical protein